jgi:hypothetical protein
MLATEPFVFRGILLVRPRVRMPHGMVGMSRGVDATHHTDHQSPTG